MSMLAYNPTGAPADFFAYDATGKVWQTTTSTFVTAVDADVLNYRITATATTPADWFTAAAPLGTTNYELRLRGSTLAGSPVIYEDVDTADAVPTGAYFDSTDLDDFYGVKNIDIYSDLSDAGVRDTARIQKWITKTDDWINLAFTRAGRTPIPIGATEADFSALSRIGAEWCGAYLAKGRGDLPQGVSNADAFDSLMDGHIERAEKALMDLVTAWEESQDDGTVSRVGAFEFIPLVRSIAITEDENSA